ncbi:MAG: hypothetical protein RL519_461, partial [Pseudomonadota bacterium]
MLCRHRQLRLVRTAASLRHLGKGGVLGHDHPMIKPQDAALAAFQAEVRAFLEAELTPALREGAARTTSVFVDPSISLPWQA